MTPLTIASILLEAKPIALRILLAGSLLAACSATPATSSQPADSSPTDVTVTTMVTVTAENTAPDGPIAIREGPASAGTYTTTLFEPPVMLTLPTDGWRFFFPDDNDEMALGNGDVELAGGRVANVLDPTTHEILPAPDDLVSWLASHPTSRRNRPSRPRSEALSVSRSMW